MSIREMKNELDVINKLFFKQSDDSPYKIMLLKLFNGLYKTFEDAVLGPNDSKQKHSIKKEFLYYDWRNADQTDTLYAADPECIHELVDPPGGGIACRRCPGWFCY